MEELISSLASMTETLNNLSENPDDESESDLQRYPPRDDGIGLGRVVVLEGLQSEAGKKLNGSHAIVIASQETDGRWECKVLEKIRTIGVKMDNMHILKPEPTVHPAYMEMAMYRMQLSRGDGTLQEDQEKSKGMYRSARGVCYNDEPVFHRARKLVQFLDYPDEDYTPNETIMLGEAYYFYCSVSKYEKFFKVGCTMYDLEHMAALSSLACMCQGEITYAVGCGDGKQSSECVLFALLEAAPRSLEVLLQFIVMTPYIGEEEDGDPNMFKRNREDPALTHAQDNDAYCNVMKYPICLLSLLLFNAPKVASRALFQSMQDRFGKLFELMLRRLFSFLARECHGTADGKALGKYTRNILARLADLEGQMNAFLFYYLCESDDPIRINWLGQRWLLQDNGIKKYEGLASFLESIVDADVAKSFYDQAQN
mmetsp:Transcript_20921/g.38374  ORF Transcript_20921/g.38374 Transcript_20921/m.38374 type:complete len:427 (-) Transcript_20921:91-1371(-)